MTVNVTLGDMLVAGDMPAKLLKACAVIADTLHPHFARAPWIASADKSKESCVLSSLTVRDFLRRVGFVNATVRPVVVVMKAWRGGETLHSLGIGMPGTPKRDGHWVGHLVAFVPGSHALIDTTLYIAMRPQWPDLAPMLATTCTLPTKDTPRLDGLAPLAALSVERDDYEFGVTYFDDPGNTVWRNGPDARDRWKRADAVDAMVKRFGRWQGKDFAA